MEETPQRRSLRLLAGEAAQLISIGATVPSAIGALRLVSTAFSRPMQVLVLCDQPAED